MWTKGDLIREAFAEIGIADYDFDLTPEEIQTGLRRLDSMMATWEAKGIRVGYKMPPSPSASNVNDDSGLPDKAVETVWANLAMRIAPSFGKPVSAETRLTARSGYDTLLQSAAFPQEQQFPSTMPRGAGNKFWSEANQPFMPPPDTGPLVVDNSGLEFLE